MSREDVDAIINKGLLPKAVFMSGEEREIAQKAKQAKERRQSDLSFFNTMSKSPVWYANWEEEMERRFSLDFLEDRLATRPTMEERIISELNKRFQFAGIYAEDLVNETSTTDYSWTAAFNKLRKDFLRDTKIVRSTETAPLPVEVKTTELGKCLVENLLKALKELRPICIKNQFRSVRLCFDGSQMLKVVANEKQYRFTGFYRSQDQEVFDVSVSFDILYSVVKLANKNYVVNFSIKAGFLTIYTNPGMTSNHCWKSNIKILEIHEEHLDLEVPTAIEKQHKHYNLLQTIALRDCEERPKLGAAYKLDDSYAAVDGIVLARSWKLEEQGNIINFPRCVAKMGTEVLDNSFMQQMTEVISLADKATYPLEVRVYAIDLKKALKRCISKNIKISCSPQEDLIVQSRSPEYGDSQTTVGCYGFQTTDLSFSVAFEKKLLLEALKPFLKDDVVSFQMAADGPSIIGIEGDYLTLIMSLI